MTTATLSRHRAETRYLARKYVRNHYKKEITTRRTSRQITSFPINILYPTAMKHRLYNLEALTPGIVKQLKIITTTNTFSRHSHFQLAKTN